MEGVTVGHTSVTVIVTRHLASNTPLPLFSLSWKASLAAAGVRSGLTYIIFLTTTLMYTYSILFTYEKNRIR